MIFEEYISVAGTKLLCNTAHHLCSMLFPHYDHHHTKVRRKTSTLRNGAIRGACECSGKEQKTKCRDTVCFTVKPTGEQCCQWQLTGPVSISYFCKQSRGEKSGYEYYQNHFCVNCNLFERNEQTLSYWMKILRSVLYYVKEMKNSFFSVVWLRTCDNYVWWVKKKWDVMIREPTVYPHYINHFILRSSQLICC